MVIKASTLDRLSGIFAPIGTPFAADESLDLGALAYNVAFYAQSGLDGYLALGSNGENKSLTEEEKVAVLKTIIAHKGADQVVMAGATYEAQRDTERFMGVAADLGADFVVVLPPAYFRDQMTDEVLYRYYSTLADETPLPLLMYNAPKFCGLTLSAALVSRLAPHPNIVGIKDSGSGTYEGYLQSASETFRVMAGSIGFLYPAMMAGAVGGTVSLANAFPQPALDLYECGVRRDPAGVAMQEQVGQLNRAISGKYGVAGVKAAMNLAGLKGGIPRRPLLPLNEGQVSELRQRLVDLSLL